MTMNNRRKSFVSIDIDESGNEIIDNDIPISYCHRCEKLNIKNLMKERIYQENETIPEDHDNWVQCHKYGLVLAKFHAKSESKLVGFIEPQINPFDSLDDKPYHIREHSKQKKKTKKEIKQHFTPDNKETDPEIRAIL